MNRIAKYLGCDRALLYLLSNETYIGTYLWGQRGRRRNPRRYNHVTDEGCAYILNHHEPIVPDDLFQRVQARLKENQFGSKGGRTNYGTLTLSGLLVCEGCNRNPTPAEFTEAQVDPARLRLRLPLRQLPPANR